MGMLNGRQDACATFAVEFSESPLKGGVLPSFSAYRDMVGSVGSDGSMNHPQGEYKSNHESSAESSRGYTNPKSIWGRDLRILTASRK